VTRGERPLFAAAFFPPPPHRRLVPFGRIPDRVEQVAALLHHDRTRLRLAGGETAATGGKEEIIGLENRT